jgi:glycosyltransferase involved in cell wall biosynthesis
MSTAFIIDPPLRNSAGHHRALASGWGAAAHENGYDVQILAHEDWPSDSLDGFEAKRVFSGEYYSVASDRDLPLATQLRLRQTAFRDTLAKPLRGISRDDVLVLTYPTAYTMNGVAAWAAGLPEERRPSLLVWLLYGPTDDEFSTAMNSTDIAIAAYDRLRRLFGDRVTFLASTQVIAAECRRLGAGDFSVLPFVALRAPMSPLPTGAVASAPLLGVVGDIQPQKGSGYIAAIAGAIEQQGLAARWLVAGSARYAPTTDRDALERLAKRDGGRFALELQPDGLEDYDGTLRTLDLVVLPYSPQHYATRGSGVAEEAAFLGVPIVAPSVIAKDRPGTVAFEDWTAEAISAAVAEAIRRLPELTEAARSAARLQASTLTRERMALLLRLFPSPRSEPVAAASPGEQLPLVDVVVTLHNYRRFVRQCLDSVARQTYPNWRCIVVDDASTDLSFAEGRALVESLGPRFTYERHTTAQGQLRAVATGVSLGSGQFVAMLDADDYLDEHALDHHIAWHLNSVDPVALTSGALAVIDTEGTRVASTLDNHTWMKDDAAVPLTSDKAFARPGAPKAPGTAMLFNPAETVPGAWFWNPTSTMVLRRSVVELIMPEEGEVGRYAADTYLALIGHAVGGSVCFSSTVASYRRHGDNGYSNAPVVGTGTLPVREISSNWPTVSAIFSRHLRARMPLFERNVARHQIERLLALTDGTGQSRPFSPQTRFDESGQMLSGAAAVDAMTYPRLLAYTAGRIWRGSTRRLLLRRPTANLGGADTLSIRDLARQVIQRTRRGLDRRVRR